MKKTDIFYLFFALTIAAVRLEVFLFPLRKIIVNGTILHHFWIGLVLLGAFLILPRKYSWPQLILLAVGLGLVVDELTYILFGNGTVAYYWSAISVSGMLALALITLVSRKKITQYFL